jgi:hypothetical protein
MLDLASAKSLTMTSVRFPPGVKHTVAAGQLSATPARLDVATAVSSIRTMGE